MLGFSERCFRRIGIRIRTNDKGSSHIKRNRTTGKPWGRLRLFINSSVMNGSTKSELAIAGVLRFLDILERACQLIICMVLSLSGFPQKSNYLTHGFAAGVGFAARLAAPYA